MRMPWFHCGGAKILSWSARVKWRLRYDMNSSGYKQVLNRFGDTKMTIATAPRWNAAGAKLRKPAAFG